MTEKTCFECRVALARELGCCAELCSACFCLMVEREGLEEKAHEPFVAPMHSWERAHVAKVVA